VPVDPPIALQPVFGLLDFGARHGTGTIEYDCEVQWSPLQLVFVGHSGEINFHDDLFRFALEENGPIRLQFETQRFSGE
jgi:hypothetical protein